MDSERHCFARHSYLKDDLPKQLRRVQSISTCFCLLRAIVRLQILGQGIRNLEASTAERVTSSMQFNDLSGIYDASRCNRRTYVLVQDDKVRFLPETRLAREIT